MLIVLTLTGLGADYATLTGLGVDCANSDRSGC